MKFTDILLGLLVIAIIGYILLYYLRNKLEKEIQELNDRKEEVMAIPVAEKLHTLKNMELSGQTKRKYESLQAEWQTLQNYKFTDVEAAIVNAEQAVDQMLQLFKAKSDIEDARELLDEIQPQMEELDHSLEDIFAVIESNDEDHAQLYERYNEARKSILNHSFEYGPAIETLEKNLNQIEATFTAYSELTSQGDYLEARDILSSVDSDLTSLEEILEKIPTMYEEIKANYEESLDDLRKGYQRMKDSGYHFKNDRILESVDEVQEQLNEAKTAIKNADLFQAQTLMDKSDREIEDLYVSMESEIEAKEFVLKQGNAIEQLLRETRKENDYVASEIDRIAQSYILHNNEESKIKELTKRLNNASSNLNELQTVDEESEIVYSDIEDELKKIRKQAEEVSEQQTGMIATLGTLYEREKEAKEHLENYDLTIRNLKRRLEKHNLPGLSEEFYDLFYRVTHQVENFAQMLNQVRIDMPEIEQFDLDLSHQFDKLKEETDRIIDNAVLTEYMIQHSNRFRFDYPEIDEAIRQAQHLFYQKYDYDGALAVIEKALRRIDSEAPTQVRRMYHTEKQNTQY